MNTFLCSPVRQRMPPVYFTSKESSSRDSNASQERERMRLIQKRLELQQERVDVDRAILEAEKEKWESERIKFVQNQNKNNLADCSVKDEVERLEELLENSQAETKRLREENHHLKQSFESLLKIPYIVDGAENEIGNTGTLEKVEQKFKELREERDMLAVQVRNQNRQIDDWKLLLPRNKILLDQAISKNNQLEKALEEYEERKQDEMCDPTMESKLVQSKLKQSKDEHVKNETATMDDMNIVCLEYSSSQQERCLSKMSTVSNAHFVKSMVIPSDLSSEDLDNYDKRFVIESEWANEDSGLGGIYTGWLDLEGHPSGGGTLRIDDGGIYIGEWKEGLRNGYGVYTSIDGAIYSGPWLNDRFEGRGTLVSETNQVYTGDWKNGQRHGSGIETWINGACYTGYYHFDKRVGTFPF